MDTLCFHNLLDAQLDITGAEGVEVIVDYNRMVVHVNVNGLCVLRICQIERNNLEVNVIK